MPRAIDFHVHLPISEFMDVAIGQYRDAVERYFRAEVKLRDIEEIAAYYAEREIVGVLLAWDAETATGRKPLAQRHRRRDRPSLSRAVRRLRQRGPAQGRPRHRRDRARRA